MKRVLKDIQTGAFTSEWIRECKAGQPEVQGHPSPQRHPSD